MVVNVYINTARPRLTGRLILSLHLNISIINTCHFLLFDTITKSESYHKTSTSSIPHFPFGLSIHCRYLVQQPNMVDANCDLCGGTGKNQCGACTGTGQRDPDPSIGDYVGGNCYTCGGEGQINCVKCNKQSAVDQIKGKLGL